jgi:hypothetical protein
MKRHGWSALPQEGSAIQSRTLFKEIPRGLKLYFLEPSLLSIINSHLKHDQGLLNQECQEEGRDDNTHYDSCQKEGRDVNTLQFMPRLMPFS